MDSEHDRYIGVAAVLAAVAIGTAASGFAAEGSKSPWPAVRPTGRTTVAGRAGNGQEPAVPHTPLPHEPTGVLTLRQAQELALRHNPELAAAAHGALAAEKAAQQAGAVPNPELDVEAEEFGGEGSRAGYDGAQTTVSLTQPVELGGKRAKRRSLARSEARLAGWDYEARRLDVLATAKQAFVDVLLAQGRLALDESRLVVADDVRKAAAERVKAGKVPLLEETKAGVELATARIERDRAIRELDVARKRLAASWGGTTPAFKEAGGGLDAVTNVQPLEQLLPLLDGGPEVARWNDEAALGRDALAMAKAQRIPDVGISAGVSRFEEDGTHAGTVGLSMAIPLFDRNAAGIAAAEHQSARAQCEQRAAQLRAVTALVEVHSRLEMAAAEALTIRDELLPGARQAFAAAQTGYREGKFGYLEVLDTQRTLNEATARHLEALAAYHKAAAEVERLTGVPLNTIR